MQVLGVAVPVMDSSTHSRHEIVEAISPRRGAKIWRHCESMIRCAVLNRTAHVGIPDSDAAA